tara:strand:+ start:939 stop:1274 length:336 start_codon:yes stop_codon:yes gene_type:complete
MAYKMKGFLYPGKSPLKEKGDPSAGDQSKYQDKPEETITSSDIPDEQTGKTTLEKKAKTKDFFGGLAQYAGKALITTGINTAVNALTRPKKSKPSRTNSASGFSSIKLGRR